MFTTACGMLEMVEPRDAFLGTLCEFALASAPGAAGEAEAGGVAGACCRGVGGWAGEWVGGGEGVDGAARMQPGAGMRGAHAAHCIVGAPKSSLT